MKTITTVFFFLFTFMLSAQQEMNPEQWQFDINQVGEKEYELIFKAKLEKGWVIYSKDTAEGGPIPASVSYTSKNVKPVGELKETGDRKQALDKMFEMEVVKFTSKEPFVIKQKVQVDDISQKVTGYVTYMLCNDTMCLPPRDAEFSFTINVTNPLQLNSDNKKLKKKPF